MRKVWIDKGTGSVCVNDNQRYKGVISIQPKIFRWAPSIREGSDYCYAKYSTYLSNDRFSILKRKKI